MPTITIDLPDTLNIPADWDARLFMLTKLHEAGIIPSEPVAPSVENDDIEVAPDPDSWFTLEQRKQFAKNRQRLEEEFAKNPMSDKEHEEYLQLVLNGPVADEETIKIWDEIQEMKKRWIQ